MSKTRGKANPVKVDKMLKEALEFCKIIGLNKVLITCDKSNKASAGVIKSCSGQLEEEFYSETYKQIIQRYVIV